MNEKSELFIIFCIVFFILGFLIFLIGQHIGEARGYKTGYSTSESDYAKCKQISLTMFERNQFIHKFTWSPNATLQMNDTSSVMVVCESPWGASVYVGGMILDNSYDEVLNFSEGIK